MVHAKCPSVNFRYPINSRFSICLSVCLSRVNMCLVLSVSVIHLYYSLFFLSFILWFGEIHCTNIIRVHRLVALIGYWNTYHTPQTLPTKVHILHIAPWDVKYGFLHCETTTPRFALKMKNFLGRPIAHLRFSFCFRHVRLWLALNGFSRGRMLGFATLCSFQFMRQTWRGIGKVDLNVLYKIITPCLLSYILHSISFFPSDDADDVSSPKTHSFNSFFGLNLYWIFVPSALKKGNLVGYRPATVCPPMWIPSQVLYDPHWDYIIDTPVEDVNLRRWQGDAVA